MPDQSPAESGPNQHKENFWTKILRRKKVNHPNILDSATTPIDKTLEEKPKVTPPDTLKSLQNWWYANRGGYGHGELFDPYNSIKFYTSDSKLPPQCPNATALSTFLKERGLIPTPNTSMILPMGPDKIKRVLPPYLKLSEIDIDTSHQVHLVSPSSEFLKLTSFKDGQFLFRGEEADTLDKAADLIIKRFEDGRMKHHQGRSIHTSPEPTVPTRAFGGAVSGNYPLIWIIKREAMDEHPVDIQNGGVEVLFPEISLKYLAGCVTSPEVAKAVEEKTKVPLGFLHTLPFKKPPTDYAEAKAYLEQIEEGLMQHVKALEK